MFKTEMGTPNSQDLDLFGLEVEHTFLPVVGNDFNLSSYLNGDANSEETLDVGTIVVPPDFKLIAPAPFIPLSPRGPPSRKDESELSNFIVEIDGSHTQKKKFLYSHMLNRIYVQMGVNFSVNFNWDVSKVPQMQMYVRATVVFADANQAEKRVERCLQHAHVTSNTQTTDEVVVHNVLRSARDIGDPNVYYCGNRAETDCWYSVVVQFNGPTGHAYNFVCSNSCSSGINRRNIDVIFTLEDASGVVYGRQSVGARVCSSPRRDKQQQESEAQLAGGKRRKRPQDQPAEDKTKKIKLEVVSDTQQVVTLPEIEVVGSHAALNILRHAYNLMETQRSTAHSYQQPVEEFDRCIANLKKMIDEFECKK
ncbi:cellular tumor antigen p53 [Bicyclus anynana]|uniref:Cellular tumor antigen p53 n=1 Tax=Bicyclus anynana TaxID=110368 RepID=A0ABM3LI38_BICAN|nr:cellular tumor antigen p53 [Bicyclus anynana]